MIGVPCAEGPRQTLAAGLFSTPCFTASNSLYWLSKLNASLRLRSAAAGERSRQPVLNRLDRVLISCHTCSQSSSLWLTREAHKNACRRFAMSRLKALLAVAGLLGLAPGVLLAQEMFVYPSKGQSAEQQEQDKFQCYSFAKGQTGFDPMAPPTTSTAPPQAEAQQGGVGRGAVRGALGGAAVGAIAGDTKKGLKIGAASGALIGGMRRSDQKQREQHNRQQWEQQEVANYTQNRNNYNRAYSACLEGRGYSVK